MAYNISPIAPQDHREHVEREQNTTIMNATRHDASTVRPSTAATREEIRLLSAPVTIDDLKAGRRARGGRTTGNTDEHVSAWIHRNRTNTVIYARSADVVTAWHVVCQCHPLTASSINRILDIAEQPTLEHDRRTSSPALHIELIVPQLLASLADRNGPYWPVLTREQRSRLTLHAATS